MLRHNLLLSLSCLALLSACTPSDQAKLNEVGANTAAIAKENTKEVVKQIDKGLVVAGKEAKSAAVIAGAALGDAALATDVKAGLAKDPELSALKIEVQATAGQVELTGTAPNAAARTRATEIAKAARGVQNVDNKLVVTAP